MRWIAVVLVMACGPRTLTPASAPIERYRGPIIDMHAHLVPPGEMASFATDMPADADLRKLDRQVGIARSALIVMARKGDAAISLEGLRDGECPQLEIRAGVDANQFILAADQHRQPRLLIEVDHIRTDAVRGSLRAGRADVRAASDQMNRQVEQIFVLLGPGPAFVSGGLASRAWRQAPAVSMAGSAHVGA